MSTDMSNQLAAQAVLLKRMDDRAEEDRMERKEAQIEAERTRREVSAELTDIRHGQIGVIRRLDKIEPVTDAFTSLKAKVAGAVIVLGLIGSIASAGLVFFKEFIMELFK